MLGRRPVLPALALLVGAPLLAACDPPPPPPTFTVDSDGAGGDADPGDGSCDDGTGACTVLAAIDEANALGAAEVVLPAGTAVGGVDAWITGTLTIRGEASGTFTGGELPGAVLRVAPGAVLALSGVDAEDGSVLVQGGLLADRVAFGSLTVQSGGTALVRNGFGLSPFAYPVIENAGVLHLQSSTLLGLGGAQVVDTAPGGETRLRSTLVVAESAAACTGTAPTSEGYNVASDATCGLVGTGDQPSTALADFFPEIGTPLLDAVPVGEAGCGTEVVHDILGHLRPVDGDGDGTAACDIGAWEAA